MSNQDELLVEYRESVAWLTLNRPERRNALSTSLLISIAQALQELQGKREIRCVVIRGAGEKAFSAGMDLTNIPTEVPEEIRQQIDARGPLQFGLDAIEEHPAPVIAMIRGYCMGAGCELSMACDLRVGSDTCQMGMPPARLGIVYPPSGLHRFIRNIGLPNTKNVFYTAKRFTAEEALRMGMLNYVVPDGELEGFTFSLATDIARNAPLSVQGHKRSLYLMTQAPLLSEEARSEIDALMARALGSEDAQEGLQAFLQKRDPVFRGE